MVKISTAKESGKDRNGLRGLPLLDCEKLPWTRLACPISQQTASEFDTFQNKFTLLGTADELFFVQNVENNIQLFLMQAHKVLFC